jgi:hypothetical protein
MVGRNQENGSDVAYRAPASLLADGDVALVVAYRAYTRRVSLVTIPATLVVGLLILMQVYRLLASELAARRNVEWPWGTAIASTALTAALVALMGLAVRRGVLPYLRQRWARRQGLRFGIDADQVLRRLF